MIECIKALRWIGISRYVKIPLVYDEEKDEININRTAYLFVLIYVIMLVSGLSLGFYLINILKDWTL